MFFPSLTFNQIVYKTKRLNLLLRQIMLLPSHQKSWQPLRRALPHHFFNAGFLSCLMSHLEALVDSGTSGNAIDQVFIKWHQICQGTWKTEGRCSTSSSLLQLPNWPSTCQGSLFWMHLCPIQTLAAGPLGVPWRKSAEGVHSPLDFPNGSTSFLCG